MTTAVVAIGGNAILKKGQPATRENQQRNLEETCRHIASIVEAGYNITLTHGNGPQVGDILIQNEVARNEVPPMPLDVCVAESQGLVGFMLQQALTEALRKACCDRIVPCVLTRVVVDEEDGAFREPSKPIGPYYGQVEAERLTNERGWHLHEDPSRGGWRRVVPSPRPITIVEAPAIGRLVRSGNDLVIAVGGGGIPVVWKEGRMEGVEAVVDKDLAAACLAKSLKDDLLVMLTDVEGAYVGYGTARERMLGTVTAEEAERHLNEGEFPPGSMGPKVEAAIDFVRSGGERAIITTPELLHTALSSKAGTQIVNR
ncbi:MAG: carbamate kinase [Methanomassiliicoccus sp.]|nr:carbamate kinase [Methanomassiliicoccus sp.]